MYRQLRRMLPALALLALAALPARAQEPVDAAVVQRIRAEAFERSRVMHIASMLTDLHGPRLTGSPTMRSGGEWVIEALRGWGIPTGRLESWGPFGRGWTNQRMVAQVTAPVPFPVIAYPAAWTPGTGGPVVAEVAMVRIDSLADLARYRGQLRGKFVMTAPVRAVEPNWQPNARRLSDEQLAQMASAPPPAPPGGRGPGGQGGNPNFQAMQALNAARTQLFRDEGVAALLQPGRGDGGTVFTAGAGSRDPANPASFPVAIVAIEHYGRIARLLELGQAVRMELDIRNTFHDADLSMYNIVAEIPGTDKADEVVMLGAHFDSWHAGTGSVDNASGSAVMLEAMRILKQSGVRLRRTVRMGLWTGEEQGLIGSRMYVRNHFADPADMKLKPEHAKLAGYFNMDNGTGQYRGVYLQGNEAVAPIFRAWMAPFENLGMTHLTIRNTGGTDHLPFNAVGLPGFQFIQDPVQYSSRTHHSNLDVYDQLIAADLMKNAVITAAFVYHTANREQLLPRKPLPRATPPPTTSQP